MLSHPPGAIVNNVYCSNHLFSWPVLVTKPIAVRRVVYNPVDEDNNSLFKIDFLLIALYLGINNANYISNMQISFNFRTIRQTCERILRNILKGK